DADDGTDSDADPVGRADQVDDCALASRDPSGIAEHEDAARSGRLDLAAVERAARASAADPVAARAVPEVDPGVDTVAMPVIHFDDDAFDDPPLDDGALDDGTNGAPGAHGGTEGDESLAESADAAAERSSPAQPTGA